MSQLECKIEGLIPDQPLTVGDVFQLRCTGERPLFAEIETKISLPEGQQHVLKVVKAEFPSQSQTLLHVTSHVPGDHKLEEIYLVSGAQGVPVSPLQFQVQSLIDPSNPPKEPFPAKGPLALATPLWFYVAFAIPVVLVLIGVVWKLLSSVQRRQWVRSIKDQRPALGAYHQLNKELRVIQRQHPLFYSGEVSSEEARKVIGEIRSSFQRYLQFEFLIPLKLSKRAYLKQLAKLIGRRDQDELRPIAKAFTELKRAETAKDLTALDCKQIVGHVREAANLAHRMAVKKGGK